MAQGEPRNTSPKPRMRNSVAYKVSLMKDVEGRPLM